MKIFELLRNPLVKTVGVMLVIYFALFANKNNPDSLGNRLSGERIKKNIREITEKGKFISNNVRLASQIAKDHEQIKNIEEQNYSLISVNDVVTGTTGNPAICGDVANFSYKIFKGHAETDHNKSNTNHDQETKEEELLSLPSQTLIIGSKETWFIERNLIGMKEGGIRELEIPKIFKDNNPILNQMFKITNSKSLKYQIKMISLAKPSGGLNVICD